MLPRRFKQCITITRARPAGDKACTAISATGTGTG
ncbi:Uncharacterised protein [Vibrio cholerae]|nr:Uncharacterised protein [Vibrio cholerae]